jgi:hypothetical protein
MTLALSSDLAVMDSQLRRLRHADPTELRILLAIEAASLVGTLRK